MGFIWHLATCIKFEFKTICVEKIVWKIQDICVENSRQFEFKTICEDNLCGKLKTICVEQLKTKILYFFVKHILLDSDWWLWKEDIMFHSLSPNLHITAYQWHGDWGLPQKPTKSEQISHSCFLLQPSPLWAEALRLL